MVRVICSDKCSALKAIIVEFHIRSRLQCRGRYLQMSCLFGTSTVQAWRGLGAGAWRLVRDHFSLIKYESHLSWQQDIKCLSLQC